jgi:cobalt-zinc-cadmium efflux system membrane fusion protein
VNSKWTAIFVGALILLVGAGYLGYESDVTLFSQPEQPAEARSDHEDDRESHQSETSSRENTHESEHGGKHREKGSAEERESHDNHGSESSRRVHLTPEQRKPLSITVEKANAGSARSLISRPATVRFNADSVVQVGPRVSGKVEKNLVNLGESIRQGQTIALMSSTRLGKARAHYLTAKARLETERASYQREKKLYEQDISSEAAMLEARARYKEAQANLRAAREKLRLYGVDESNFSGIDQSDGKPLSYFYLESPIDGVLQQRDAVAGQTIGPKQTPYHVVNTESVWVTIDAYEQDIPYVKPGQSVSLEVRSLPNTTFSGHVNWVSKELDPQTRTLPVRAVVQNKDGLLKSGMYARATIQTESTKKNALIPVGAVQTIHKKPAVFVPGHKDGVYRVVPVKTGDENRGMVEIVSGLRPGEKLVTDGAFDLKSILTAKSRSAAHSH